jgi:hypothetical protein
MAYQQGDRVQIRVTTNFIRDRFKVIGGTIIKVLPWADGEFLVASDDGRDLIVNECAFVTE